MIETVVDCLPEDIAHASYEVRAHYLKLIADGQTEAWSIMCALQQPPGTKGTDRAFQEGRMTGNWLDDMPLAQAKRIVREAKGSGISIEGKQYVSGLANKLGHCDPRAWVSDVGDIRQVAKERNLQVRGIVDIDSRDEGPPIRRDFSNRILKELVKKEIANNPRLSKAAATESAKAKHLPHWKKHRT